MNLAQAKKHLFIIFICAMPWISAAVETTLANIFGDEMVLQREKPVCVWGWSQPQGDVTVSFATQRKTTVANEKGEWSVQLDPMPASSENRDLTVISKKNTITLKNILVGDVWVCAGQSNMAYPMTHVANSKEERDKANEPKLRVVVLRGNASLEPQANTLPAPWKSFTKGKVDDFPGTSTFFGLELVKALDIPIGLINCAIGNTRIETFMPREELMMNPLFTGIKDNLIKLSLSDNPENLKKLKNGLNDIHLWLEDAEKRVKEGRYPNGACPPLPNMITPFLPTANYNTYIAPIAPFAIRGAIWYQGESNTHGVYTELMMSMVRRWRDAWKQGDFPFFYVQLANFSSLSDGWSGGTMSLMREAQLNALAKIPNSGMAVAIDIGEVDVHPKNKQDVGKRLSLWALNKCYDKKEIVPSGPLFKNAIIDDNVIRIQFDYADSGLMVGKKQDLNPVEEIPGGTLVGFGICENNQWQEATAVIKGNEVIVSSSNVKKPTAVRYAFGVNPPANLYNRNGLPASPFRTDK